MALARAFGVTTDELLSPDEPEEAPQGDGAQGAQETSGGGYSYEYQPGAVPPPPAGGHGLGFLERLIRRWGWLAGVYIALSGLGLTIVGALARFAFSRMYTVTAGDVLDGMMGSMLDGMGDGWTVSVPDGWEGMLPDGMAGVAAGVDSMGQVFMAIATAILNDRGGNDGRRGHPGGVAVPEGAQPTLNPTSSKNPRRGRLASPGILFFQMIAF